MTYFQLENMKRWAIGAGAVVAAIVLAVVLFNVITARERISDVRNEGERALIEVHDASAVRMTVRGRLVGNEEHRSYEVILRPHTREIRVLAGYDRRAVLERSFSNNWDAYTEISFALRRMGMMRGHELPERYNDVRGICPNGELMTFEVLDGYRVVQKLWRTSCNGDRGSFTGDHRDISNLILTQIPEHRSLLREAGW
jgi:hypothetical protein